MKNIKVFIWKLSVFGGEMFSIYLNRRVFRNVCFRNVFFIFIHIYLLLQYKEKKYGNIQIGLRRKLICIPYCNNKIYIATGSTTITLRACFMIYCRRSGAIFKYSAQRSIGTCTL